MSYASSSEPPAPPPAPQSRSNPRDGLIFGKYMIIRLLAKGGTSEVYEAMHIGLKKSVALKVLRPDLAAHADARTDFLREGENAARIRHPHIVDVTDLGAVDQLPYIVMELLNGQDLACTYADRGPMSVSDVVDLLLPVVSAVAAGHAQGVIHGDLKPANIFLHREGPRVIPKLLDFGLSRRLHERRAVAGSQIFGTPHYMAPEQARGGTSVDARTDQYSMGVMLYEGVTGRLPRDDEDPQALLVKVAREGFPAPSELIDLPPEVEAVILRMMAADRVERYTSMIEVAQELCHFASEPVREYWSGELAVEGLADPAIRVGTPSAQRHSSQQYSGRYNTNSRPLQAVGQDPRPSRPSHVPRAGLGVPRDSQQVDLVMSGQAKATDSFQVLAHYPNEQQPVWKRPGLWAAAIGAAAVALFAVRFLAGEGANPTVEANAATAPAVVEQAPKPLDVEVHTEPAAATLVLDGQRVGTGHFRGQVLDDGSLHELRVLADGFLPQTVTFRHDPPPALISLMKKSALAGANEAEQAPPRPRPEPRRAVHVARSRSTQRANHERARNRAAAEPRNAPEPAGQAEQEVVAPIVAPEPDVTLIRERDPSVDVVSEIEAVE